MTLQDLAVRVAVFVAALFVVACVWSACAVAGEKHTRPPDHP